MEAWRIVETFGCLICRSIGLQSCPQFYTPLSPFHSSSQTCTLSPFFHGQSDPCHPYSIKNKYQQHLIPTTPILIGDYSIHHLSSHNPYPIQNHTYPSYKCCSQYAHVSEGCQHWPSNLKWPLEYNNTWCIMYMGIPSLYPKLTSMGAWVLPYIINASKLSSY